MYIDTVCVFLNSEHMEYDVGICDTTEPVSVVLYNGRLNSFPTYDLL